MEKTLSSRHSNRIEENDITLVLEQLQENGFSSFFDHPDCPFSSIQEVDEALKELEKEFLKICVDQDSKSGSNRKKSMTASQLPSKYGKKKPKSRQPDLRKEYVNTSIFGNRDRNDKRETVIKKQENPKFGLPSTSRSNNHFPEHGKPLNPAECGDSKDVFGVDSCGNKYSLKIEVFATVKLEPDEKKEPGKMLKATSKVLLSRSKPNGMQWNENHPAYSPVVLPNNEQTGNCRPLVLNYKSSVSKPCPSYMYPTACDLKKTIFAHKHEAETFQKTIRMEDDRINNYNFIGDSKPVNFIEVGRSTMNKLSVERIKGAPDVELILRQEPQHEVQFNGDNAEGRVFEKNFMSNYSSVYEKRKSELMISHPNQFKDVENHSIEVQTSIYDNINPELKTALDNVPEKLDNLKIPEPPKMSTQGQQTSFENVPICLNDESTEEIASISESKSEMIDKEVETSLFLLFDQNLINELKGLEEMMATNFLTEENFKEICENDNDYEETNTFSILNDDLERKFPEFMIDFNNKGAYNFKRDVSRCRQKMNKEFDSEHNENYVTPVDVGIGTDIPVFTFSASGEHNEVAVFFQENGRVDDSDLYIGSPKIDDKDMSDSSSNETVIMKDNGFESENRETNSDETERTLMDKCTSTDGNSVVYTPDGSDVDIPADFFQCQTVLVDKGVGTSYEVFMDGNIPNLVDKEVDTMSKELIFENCEDHIQNQLVDSPDEVEFVPINMADKLVGMSDVVFTSPGRTIFMVDKGMRTSSLTIETIMDKERNSRIYCDNHRDNMIDKETGTASMSRNFDGSLKNVSVREVGTSVSKHSGILRSRCCITDKENSGEIESKNDSKFAKWSKSKVPIGQKFFRKPDAKFIDSEKFMKLIKQRREKRKSEEEGSVKSKELTTKKDKPKQEDEKDNICCSTWSPEQSKIDKWREISEYETKFVKGVFTRHSSITKNKIAFRRRAFSNLDQKFIASKLARSRKIIGNKKKSSWEQSKSHSSIKMKRMLSKELSGTDYRLPDGSVISVVE